MQRERVLALGIQFGKLSIEILQGRLWRFECVLIGEPRECESRFESSVPKAVDFPSPTVLLESKGKAKLAG